MNRQMQLKVKGCKRKKCLKKCHWNYTKTLHFDASICIFIKT